MIYRSKHLPVLAILVCAATLYVYPLALPTPLLDPDEGVHATIALEMSESGDYLVPRFCGETFRDKPFLYSAAQALSLRAFGVNEAAVRLPGFAFALLGSVTTIVLAWRVFDRETAIYAGLASLTLVLPVILAQSPAHDVALVPWTNLLILAFWEHDQTGEAARRWAWVAVMSICVALALITKGLIGVAVVSSGLAMYAILSRRISARVAVRFAVALLVGGIIASPWFLKMERVSPGYLNYYFIERHFLGYITDSQEHGEMPWHFYFGPVLGGAMPWLLYAAIGVMHSRYDADRHRSSAVLLFTCCFVGGFLFLILAGSKLLTYSLPIFPPIAILAGVGFRYFFDSELSPAASRLFGGVFRLAAAFGVISPIPALLVLQWCLATPLPIAAYGVAALASLAMALGFILFERGHGRAALAIGMLWFPLMFVTLMTWPVQPLAEMNSQRALARLLNSREVLPQQTVLLGQRVASVLFYSTPPRRKWLEAGHIREADDIELNELIRPSVDTIIAITSKELRRSDRAQDYYRLKPRTAGPFNVLLNEPREVTVATQPSDKRQ